TRELAVQEGVAQEARAKLDGMQLTRQDLVILATPVSGILHHIKMLPRLAPRGCMVMDIGSTKLDICLAMNDLPGWFQAIGAHPMCGKEVSGYANSAPDLYYNQTFILTPTVRTTPHLRELLLEIIKLIGANPVTLPPKEHDQTVALISHLPYLLAATLMQQASVAAEAYDDPDVVWHVSASGFRDTSRVSGSSPAMMRDILLTNQQAVLAQLLRYQRELSAVIEMVNTGDPDEVATWLTEKRKMHIHYRRIKTGQP
ncbi:MAG: prephenate dehydrogenase, partial [Candidatus Promineifilaceae bacterium]